jgi:adenine phosphoribosyltransferase
LAPGAVHGRGDLLDAAGNRIRDGATVIDFKQHIREIPDFPKPGIIFRDITPLLADGVAFHDVVDRIAERYRGRVDMVLGIESRGFIVGAPVAYALRAGLAVVRKPGKLPALTFAAQYALEYGNDTLEIHRDAFGHPCRVLIVDDLLATGGTACAAVKLVERLGGEIVECAFLIELEVLKGRDRLYPHPVFSVMQYRD